MAKAGTRQLFTSVHRYLGLSTFLFLTIAALTGCFLCFDKTIDAALNPALFRSASVGLSASPLSLVARLERARPDLAIEHFPLDPPRGRTIQVGVHPRHPAMKLGYDQLFLDPRDGHVVGTRQSGPGWDRPHIVEGVFQFHQNLLAGRWGRWLMGLGALGWLIGNAVGFYLTLPVGSPFWRKWKKNWQISRRARLRRFMLELHQSSGLWLLIGAMVLAFTSVAMNFYDEVFSPIAMTLSPARSSPFDRPAAAREGETPAIGIERAVAIACGRSREQWLGWHPAAAGYVADRNLYSVSFTSDGRENYRWLGPVTYYLDATSGRFVYADDPYHDSAGRKLGRSLYPLHSGEVIGSWGIAIIFLLGIATAEMCVTGIYTWWKKRRSRLAMETAKLAARRTV